MWFDVQALYPLLTIGLAVALCFVVASFFISRQAPNRAHLISRAGQDKKRRGTFE